MYFVAAIVALLALAIGYYLYTNKKCDCPICKACPIAKKCPDCPECTCAKCKPDRFEIVQPYCDKKWLPHAPNYDKCVAAEKRNQCVGESYDHMVTLPINGVDGNPVKMRCGDIAAMWRGGNQLMPKWEHELKMAKGG